MEMSGHYVIAAPRQKVWEGLNDPDVLAKSIPGCEYVERQGDETLEAAVTAKVGPVKAKFKGTVTLSDLNPPESYTISGEGKGGAAGFAKGSADVKLTEQGEETRLDYEVKASVGGKLAQVGGRLIDSTAKKMADEFFSNFGEIVAGAPAEKAGEEKPAETPAEEPRAEQEPPSEEEEGAGLPVWAWAGGLIVLVLLGLWYFLG